MVTSRTSAPPQFDQEKEADLRGWINWLDMWRLCANTACERTRCCRGKPSACFPENFPRLPLGARDGFLLLLAAKEDGLPFDAAWAELARVGLVAELSNWHDLAHGSGASGAVT